MTKDQLPVAGGVRRPSQRSVPGPGPRGGARRTRCRSLPRGIEEHGADAELVVALTEGGGAHHTALAHNGLGRELPAFDRRLTAVIGNRPK